MAEGARPFGRRGFVSRLALAAGVAPEVAALLEGRVDALPRGEDTDFSVLSASIALEHHAVAVYETGLRLGLFPAGLKAHAVEFRGDHQGHRDTQIAIARDRGGEPPEPLARYELGRLETWQELVRAALAVEEGAQRAYLKLLSQIRTRDYLLSAAFILVDEVRHMTVWRRVLGLRIY